MIDEKVWSFVEADLKSTSSLLKVTVVPNILLTIETKDDSRHFNTYKATTHQSGIMLAIKAKGKRRGKLREIGSSSVH
jgi:hypothetical protein